MSQNWQAILENGIQDSSLSFIGGKPCIPPSVELPACKICGTPLTFFFQVAFPEGHIWYGKSLALFYCSSSYEKHSDKEQFPPSINSDARNNFKIPEGKLNPETYQTLFRAIVFNTSDGVLRDDYHERVSYQKISWKPSSRLDKKVPIILGEEPIWVGIRKYGKEFPAYYGDQPMKLILQIADYFNFDRLPDAPPEMEEDFFGDDGAFVPREEPNYTLFFEFNRIYLWGTSDPENPVVYLSVQNDI